MKGTMKTSEFAKRVGLHPRDAVEEMISFIYYITSKIYGSRSYKKKRIEKCIREVINAPDNEHSNEKEERNQ